MSVRASGPTTILRGRRLLLVRAVWTVIVVLAVGLFLASIPGYASNVLNLGRATWMGAPVEAPTGLAFVLDLVAVLASITSALVCLALAGVLFRRRSDDWMVIFISSYLLLYGTVMAGPLERAEAFYPGWPSLAIAVVQPMFFTAPTIALFVLFPDGRFVPRWTRWLVLLSIPLTVAFLYQPLAYLSYSWVPIGVVVICAVYAQVYRYRNVSAPAERQQTKWVLFGILSWLLLLAMLSVPYSIELSLPPGSPLPWWSLVSSTGWWLTLTLVPLSLTVAVLRYRLYDIDLVINRTLVYGALTLMLAAVYLGGVTLLQGVLRELAGHESDFAVVVSTLVIAALFNPLRKRIQDSVDRRFYRRKYDAARTLGAFSVCLREETDLGSLRSEVLAVVRDTVQPENVSLWMREPTGNASRNGPETGER
jgi:hypothetical protein